MWSGPRTLSTALMRSFGNRADTVVVDEPLYGYYLAATGIDHPGRDQIIESMSRSWADVVRQLTAGELPPGKTVFYAKHMTHHLLPEIERDTLAGLRHAFLIRDPRRLLASYAKVRDTPTLADLGLEQQVEIFLAAGAAADRRDMGEVLVRQRLGIDRLLRAPQPGRALRAGRTPTRARAARRPLPAVLRRNGRTPANHPLENTCDFDSSIIGPGVTGP
jgi:hypothetical protein